MFPGDIECLESSAGFGEPSAVMRLEPRAASPRARLSTGRFFFDRQARRTHLLPFTRESEEERRDLWKLCERLSAERPR